MNDYDNVSNKSGEGGFAMKFFMILHQNGNI